MSLRSRFGHLEQQRPNREDGSARRPTERFDALEQAPLPFVCARCGAPLAGHDAACATCAATSSGPLLRNGDHPMAAHPASRTRRFEALSEPALELAREVPPREGDGIAAAVPAWRGGALPDDVAEEVRRQLGLPAPPPAGRQREELLRWADERLRAERRERRLELLAGLFFGRHLLGQVAALVVLALFLGGLVLARACGG